MSEFEDIFNEICYTKEASAVFTDFLNYCIDQFLVNPGKQYFPYDKYTVEEKMMFNSLFEAYILTMNEKLQSHDYYDFLGEFYEDIIISKYKAGSRGQFFTPVTVTRLMAELTYHNQRLTDDPCTCYDCACGSGRTLLSWHKLRPQDICVGWDLDEQAAKMCVVNFLMHGVKGSVVWCNSLSYDFFDAWKVNEFPFTVMKVNGFRESTVFIGYDKSRNSSINDEDTGQTVLL